MATAPRVRRPRTRGRIVCSICERIDDDGTSDFATMLADHDTATAFLERWPDTTT